MPDCPDTEQEFCRHENPADACDDCAEAQQQQFFSDYYGGDAPQTSRERQIAEYKEKRRIG